MPMSELEHARDLLGKAFVESERVVKGKASTPSVSKADSSLKDGTDGKKFSI